MAMRFEFTRKKPEETPQVKRRRALIARRTSFMSLTGLILLGLIVHVLVMFAVFDVYFSSPIDHGMTPIKSTKNPPADRVVFIVADGLRMEAIYGEDWKQNAPNLNAIRESRASWGVAHTRVPTESRPGHVALLGGIYEDPASILKGWKVNPVDFDSVINQSTNAWCWGGPSIINIFNKDNLSHIHLHSYDPKMEDFGNADTISLDLWVFDQVKQFVADQKQCNDCTDFYKTGNVFFLHLLGIDTAGHAFKPASAEYNNNIKFIDGHIVQIEELFEDAFPDERTVYVFTADHGMTDWGSHGAGSDHETKVPIIAWGAGIEVENKQKDLEQVDIAPFLSALIGINYPINSLGKVPYSYINAPNETINEIIFSNLHQLRETFNVKQDRIARNAYRFVPFQNQLPWNIQAKVSNLKHLFDLNDFGIFRTEATNLMNFLIQGIDYYHNYFQLPILISMTIGFVAWIVYVGTFNVSTHIRLKEETMFLCKYLVFAPLCSFVFVLVNRQSLPLMYYFYFIFPVGMTFAVFTRYGYVMQTLKNFKQLQYWNVLPNLVVYGLGLRALVLVFADRAVLTPLLIVMAGTIFFVDDIWCKSSRRVKILWVSSCLALSLYPHFPTMETGFNVPLYLTGYVLWIASFYFHMIPDLSPHPQNKYIFRQMAIFILTPIYTLAIEYKFISSTSQVKYFSWIWALLPILMIVLTPTMLPTRISSVFVGFGTFYLMVTYNHEILFLMCYVLALYMWMETESYTYPAFEQQPLRHLTIDDYRRAFFFVAFIFIGFFGTGNIASLNSFDPMWVRCFLTVFQPFKMASLILLRIAVPFIFASTVFCAINMTRKATSSSMFCIVMMYSDIILLELMYHITNVGSWLEIGVSLSRFIIMEAFVIILLLLNGLAHIFLRFHYPRVR